MLIARLCIIDDKPKRLQHTKWFMSSVKVASFFFRLPQITFASVYSMCNCELKKYGFPTINKWSFQTSTNHSNYSKLIKISICVQHAPKLYWTANYFLLPNCRFIIHHIIWYSIHVKISSRNVHSPNYQDINHKCALNV